MPLNASKQQVLTVLAEKVNQDPSAGLIDTAYIANQLNISVDKTKEIIKSMGGMGIIESSIECDYTLITQKGLGLLE